MGTKISDYRRSTQYERRSVRTAKRVRKDSPEWDRRVKHRVKRDREIDARLDRKHTRQNTHGWQ